MRYSLIAIISVAGQLFSLGLAFLFHFLMARMLGLTAYGELGVLLSVFTILIFPIISVQAVLMREVAKLQIENENENAHWLIAHYFKQGFIFAIPLSGLAFVILFYSGLINDPLNSSLVLMSVPVFYSIFIFNSYLQGQQKPIHFASILVLSDLLRLLISVFLVYYGLNLLGATASYAIGSLILFIPILLILYFRNKSNTKEYAFSLKANLIHVFPTYLLLAFLLTGDLFFVKYFADPESAGLYTAASTLARSIFFVSIGVMNAFLPQSSKFDLKKDLPKISKPLFISTLLLLMFSSGIYVTKDLLLSVLYGFEGSNLLIASSVLGALTISIFFLSVSILLINLLWSQNEQKIPLIISIFGVLIALIIMFWFANSNKPLDVAIASLIYNFILVVLCLAAVLKKYIFKLAPSPSRPN